MENHELVRVLNAYFNWNKSRMYCFVGMLLALIKVRTINLTEFARQEKHRCYRRAKRSATECAAILDIGLKLGLIEINKLNHARDLLFRIVSMLIKMVSPAL